MFAGRLHASHPAALPCNRVRGPAPLGFSPRIWYGQHLTPDAGTGVKRFRQLPRATARRSEHRRHALVSALATPPRCEPAAGWANGSSTSSLHLACSVLVSRMQRSPRMIGIRAPPMAFDVSAWTGTNHVG